MSNSWGDPNDTHSGDRHGSALWQLPAVLGTLAAVALVIGLVLGT